MQSKALIVKIPHFSYKVHWTFNREQIILLVDYYKKKYSNNLVITNNFIYNIYKNFLLQIFPYDNILFIPDSETSKSLENVKMLANTMITKNYDRNSCIWAFGGGVIGDISGFLASVYMRGISYIQLPTTLLAMVDSSVGGKTAVNLKEAKNAIGSFYQPRAVLAHLDFLKTLPTRQLHAGIAEVVKSAIIYDKNFFYYIEKNIEKIKKNDIYVFYYLSQKSIAIKSKIVQKDEKEKSEIRSMLNFGHTLAHALESYTSYQNNILHGEAVSIGMGFATYFSYKKKFLHKTSWIRIRNLLLQLGLSVSLGNLAKKNESKQNFAKKIIYYMQKDKKNNSNIRYVFISNIGKCFLPKEEKEQIIYQALLEYIELEK